VISGPEDSLSAAITQAHRAEWAQVFGTVVRVTRDFDLAEDCVQAAFVQALLRWGRDGVPYRPGAWLTTVAVREALQAKRRAATITRRLPLLVEDAEAGGAGSGTTAATVFDNLPDDRLRLIFTCCHPALSSEARVALTLRMVCGLTSAEVAKAFLVKEATMQARITRAKKKIVEARIAYRTPTPAELPERLESVLDTVQLVYSAGHLAAGGDTLLREDLADRALDIARMLHELLPEDCEVSALLAFLVLTDARRAARVDAEGNLVTLDGQDRALWDPAAISEGRDILRWSLDHGARGRYAILACIAAVHVEAPTAADTDWEQIVQLYDVLLQRWPTPVVALNRAIAVGSARGPAAGLAELEPLSTAPDLVAYPYLPAARADFLRRLGRPREAAESYREALLLTGNEVEARYLHRRLAEVGDPQ
jgi:RNA polymerase sigma-70 factor (ECF subfamily)